MRMLAVRHIVGDPGSRDDTRCQDSQGDDKCHDLPAHALYLLHMTLTGIEGAMQSLHVQHSKPLAARDAWSGRAVAW